MTLTGDTWVATAGDDNAITQAIIDGLVSAQAEAAGWNVEVIAALDHTHVVRDGDNVTLTITLPAVGAYVITANEVITDTIPGTALTGGSPIEADSTFTITADESATLTVFRRRREG